MGMFMVCLHTCFGGATPVTHS